MLRSLMAVSLARWIYYACIPTLLYLNYIVFNFFGFGYINLYLEHGTKVSAAILLGSFAVDNLPQNFGLLSKNAADYSRSVLFFASTVTREFGQFLISVSDREKLHSQSIWDGAMLLFIIGPVVVAMIITWVFVVSPVNYLVTLVAGAPARSSDFIRRIYPSIAATNPLVSKPFAFTQALATLLLLLASQLHKAYPVV